MHPFSPPDQTKGYSKIISDLQKWISEIVGLKSVSFQPNAGSQGEFAGLLAINSYFESKGELLRKKCLIPKSAHEHFLELNIFFLRVHLLIQNKN